LFFLQGTTFDYDLIIKQKHNLIWQSGNSNYDLIIKQKHNLIRQSGMHLLTFNLSLIIFLAEYRLQPACLLVLEGCVNAIGNVPAVNRDFVSRDMSVMRCLFEITQRLQGISASLVATVLGANCKVQHDTG
jgi:hypothetical protein